jgi:hypothetical protein
MAVNKRAELTAGLTSKTGNQKQVVSEEKTVQELKTGQTQDKCISNRDLLDKDVRLLEVFFSCAYTKSKTYLLSL